MTRRTLEDESHVKESQSQQKKKSRNYHFTTRKIGATYQHLEMGAREIDLRASYLAH